MRNIISTLVFDFRIKGFPQRIPAVEGDSNTRSVLLLLYDGGDRYSVPEDASVVVRYGKRDKTGGIYDTLPNGERAWEVTEKGLVVSLAPQMFTCPGVVEAQIQLRKGSQSLSTFTFELNVEKDPSRGLNPSKDYFNWYSATIDALKEYLGEHGAGMTDEERKLLFSLFKNAKYKKSMSAELKALAEMWGIEISGGVDRRTSSILGVGVLGRSVLGSTGKASTTIPDDEENAPSGGVTSVNGKTGAVTLTAEDVGALPANTKIPDVPEWAMQPTKPTYTADDVGTYSKSYIDAALGAYITDLAALVGGDA